MADRVLAELVRLYLLDRDDCSNIRYKRACALYGKIRLTPNLLGAVQ